MENKNRSVKIQGIRFENLNLLKQMTNHTYYFNRKTSQLHQNFGIKLFTNFGIIQLLQHTSSTSDLI